MKLQSSKQLTDCYLKRFSEKPSDPPRKVSLNTSLKLSVAVKKQSDSLNRRMIAGQNKGKQRVSQSPDDTIDGNAGKDGGRMQRTHTLVDIYTDPSPRSLSPGGAKRLLSKTSESIQSLNRSLTDKLRALGSNYDLKSRFLVFQELFTSVIALDPIFGLLLQRIKNGYEEAVTQVLSCDYEQEVVKMGTQLQEMQEMLESFQSEKDVLTEALSKVKAENQILQGKCSEQTLLCKGKDKRISELEQELTDPAGLGDIVKNLQEEVCMLKKRETLLLSAVRPHAKLQVKHRKTQSTCTPTAKLLVPRLNLRGNAELFSPVYKEWEDVPWNEASMMVEGSIDLTSH